MQKTTHLGLMTALAGLALSNNAISKEIKDLWNLDVDVNDKVKIPTDQVAVSVESLERITQAQAKRLRKQAKRVNTAIHG